MDAARALLDRELLLSGIVHDLRGPLTAVQGWAELEEEQGNLGPAGAIARVSGLLDAVADAAPRAAEVATFADRAVRVKGPIDVLRIAVDDLPHAATTVEDTEDAAIVRIEGVPAAEMPQGWSLTQVRRWLSEGGPGLAGARLRIASRIVGAVKLQAALVPGGAHGTVTIWLPRG